MYKEYKLLKSIIQLLRNLDKSRKFEFICIIFINIINGLFEFINLGSALLFLEALTNPSNISQNLYTLITKFNLSSNINIVFLILIMCLLST